MPQATNRTGQNRGPAQAARTAARDATHRTEDVMRTAADETDEMMENVTETVSRTADAAVDITQRVADQGREVIWLGMRAAAGVNGRLADVGYGSSHRLLEQASRMMEIYGQASEATAENLQTLFTSWLSLGRGMQQMQQTWFSLLDRSVNDAVHKPQDLLRCKSLVEVADTQRELYVKAVERAVESGATLLQLAERVAREATGPLRSRARA